MGLVFGYSDTTRGFFNIILIDGIAIFSILIILIASLFFVFLIFDDENFQEKNSPEFFALFLFMLAGYEFMMSSENLMLIFIGLEISSLCLYALIAMRDTKFCIEAAIKYFTMGAVGSGFFVFGAAIFYLICGSVDISKIIEFSENQSLQNTIVLVGACMFMLVSLGFKLSFAPFNSWVADVYEGSTPMLAGFMSIVPKMAGFVVVLTLFGELIDANSILLQNILYIVAILTMTLEEIIEFISTRFTYIIIDEAQDLKGYREEFAKMIYNSNIKLILLGDDNQNINGGGEWFENLPATKIKFYTYRCSDEICKWIRDYLKIDIHGNDSNGKYIKIKYEDVLSYDDGKRTLLYVSKIGNNKEIIDNWKGPKETIKKAKGSTILGDIVLIGRTLNKKNIYTAVTRTCGNAYSTISKIGGI